MKDAVRLANYLGVDRIQNPPMTGNVSLPQITLPTPPADQGSVKFAAAAFQGAGRMQNWTQPWFDWGTFRVLPNVRVWRPSQDAGSPPEHTYLAGWFAILAMDEVIPAIYNDNNCAFALNRDWTPGLSPNNLVIKNNIGALIQDIAVSPVFAGSNYPIGGFN